MFKYIYPHFTDAVIGFDSDSYTVNEGAPGIVTFTVRVLTGQLQRSVEIGFSTVDGTALGMVIVWKTLEGMLYRTCTASFHDGTCIL